MKAFWQSVATLSAVGAASTIQVACQGVLGIEEGTLACEGAAKETYDFHSDTPDSGTQGWDTVLGDSLPATIGSSSESEDPPSALHIGDVMFTTEDQKLEVRVLLPDPTVLTCMSAKVMIKDGLDDDLAAHPAAGVLWAVSENGCYAQAAVVHNMTQNGTWYALRARTSEFRVSEKCVFNPAAITEAGVSILNAFETTSARTANIYIDDVKPY